MLRTTLICCALLLASCVEPPAHVVQRGDALPEMQLRDLDGNVVFGDDLFRGKVVILNVWATWCPPCRKEMPDLLKLSQVLPSDRFIVVGLSVDQSLNDLRAYVKEHQLTFPVFRDPGGKEIAGPRLGIFKYPETLVVNRQGKVVTKVIGAYPWASKETVQALRYIGKYDNLPPGGS